MGWRAGDWDAGAAVGFVAVSLALLASFSFMPAHCSLLNPPVPLFALSARFSDHCCAERVLCLPRHHPRISSLSALCLCTEWNALLTPLMLLLHPMRN
jgi:hypothetical protein